MKTLHWYRPHCLNNSYQVQTKGDENEHYLMKIAYISI